MRSWTRGARGAWFGAMLGVAGVLAAPAANAQFDPTKPAAAEADDPSQPPTPGKPIDTRDRKAIMGATSSFKKGMRAAKGGDHDAAILAFRESYGLVASPNPRLMIAHSLRAKGDPAGAYIEAGEAADVADAAAQKKARYGKTADAARKLQEELKAEVGFVSVSVTLDVPNPKLMVNRREIPRSKWGQRFPMNPGAHTILLLSDHGTENRQVEVKKGGQHTVSFAPPKPPPAPAPKKTKKKEKERSVGDILAPQNGQETAGYALMGGGAVSLILFGVFGSLSQGIHDDLSRSCNSSTLVCPTDLEADRDQGATFQTVANVTAIAGGVMLTTGAALFIVSRTSSDDEDGADAATKAGIAPVTMELGVTPGGLQLRGTF